MRTRREYSCAWPSMAVKDEACSKGMSAVLAAPASDVTLILLDSRVIRSFRRGPLGRLPRIMVQQAGCERRLGTQRRLEPVDRQAQAKRHKDSGTCRVPVR